MAGKLITPAEDAALIQFVRWSISSLGYAPTYREIGRKVGLRSSSSVHAHIERLVDKGYLTRVAGEPRTLQTTPEGMEFALANN